MNKYQKAAIMATMPFVIIGVLIAIPVLAGVSFGPGWAAIAMIVELLVCGWLLFFVLELYGK